MGAAGLGLAGHVAERGGKGRIVAEGRKEGEREATGPAICGRNRADGTGQEASQRGGTVAHDVAEMTMKDGQEREAAGRSEALPEARMGAAEDGSTAGAAAVAIAAAQTGGVDLIRWDGSDEDEALPELRDGEESISFAPR